MSMLVKWLRHRDLRGQSFSCSYVTDVFCVWRGVNQVLFLYLWFSVGIAHVDTAMGYW